MCGKSGIKNDFKVVDIFHSLALSLFWQVLKMVKGVWFTIHFVMCFHFPNKRLSILLWPLFLCLSLNLHCNLLSIWLIFIVAHLLWRFVLSTFKMKRIDHSNMFQRDCDEERKTFRTDMGTIKCENSKYSVDSLFSLSSSQFGSLWAIINLIIIIWNMISFQLSNWPKSILVHLLKERREIVVYTMWTFQGFV